ncbi:MAG: hypothetical protein AAGL17_03395 [Cyanobacteria bacterium J06576_12]
MKKGWQKRGLWLALCVSLGIHGISAMLPVAEPTPSENPEIELPEPVDIVPLSSIGQPEDAPDAPPPPRVSVESPIEPPPVVFTEPPEPIEPEPIEPEPIEPEPVEPEPMGSEPTEVDPLKPDPQKPNLPSEPVPEVFDPTGTDLSDLSGYTNFSNTLLTLDDSVVAQRIVNVTYDLDYLGELCFAEASSVNGTLAVAIDSSPKLEMGQIVTKTGYVKIEEEIKEWFEQLRQGQAGNTDELSSAADVTLYDWIEQEANAWFLNDEDFEAYFVDVKINLVNNTCAQN